MPVLDGAESANDDHGAIVRDKPSSALHFIGSGIKRFHPDGPSITPSDECSNDDLGVIVRDIPSSARRF